MNILVLVDKSLADLPKNQATLHELSAQLDTQGKTIDVHGFSEAELSIETSTPNIRFKNQFLSDYAFVFFRRVGKYKSLASLVSSLCDSIGVRFVDSIYRNTVGTGKAEQMFRLALASIAVPKSYFSPHYTPESIKRASSFLTYPLVLKDSHGQLGKNVFLAHSEEKLIELLRAQDQKKEWLLQEFIPNEFDYRILVLGGKAVVAEQRVRNTSTHEFRNNISLGAEEHFVNLDTIPPDVITLAINASQALGVEVAGVDIVTNTKTNRSYVLEVNRCPGFTHGQISGEIKALAHYISSLCPKK